MDIGYWSCRKIRHKTRPSGWHRRTGSMDVLFAEWFGQIVEKVLWDPDEKNLEDKLVIGH